MAKKSALKNHPPAADPPAPEVEFFYDVEQGSDEWHQLRCGIPTASHFSTIMADGKDGGESLSRKQLLYMKAGEVLTGKPSFDYKNADMERGHKMEPAARDYYARTTFTTLTNVGFVRRKLPSGAYVGCSPDSLVTEKHGLEIKTMRPDLICRLMDNGARFPAEHRAQVHGTMWVAGLDSMDLQVFYEGMPIAPRWRIERDDNYIREISNAVEVFEYDLRQFVKRMKACS